MWVLAVALGPVMIDDMSRVQEEAQQVAQLAHESEPELVATVETPIKKTGTAGRTPASVLTKTR